MENEVVDKKDLKTEIEEVLNNPVVKNHAFINAQDIKKRCKGWFTVEQIAKKIMQEPQPVFDLLGLLCLFGYCYRKEYKPGIIRYKITFSDNDKILIYEEELKELQEKSEEIIKHIAALRSKLKDQQNLPSNN